MCCLLNLAPRDAAPDLEPNTYLKRLRGIVLLSL